MLNDKDDKFDGQEESEYHFSDEDVTYEVEPESPKPERPPAGESAGAKTNFLNKLTQSKRMLISGAVFILLIFVVYKMVSPTAQAPQTDITAQTAPPPPAPMPAAPQQAVMAPSQPLPPAAAPQVAQVSPAGAEQPQLLPGGIPQVPSAAPQAALPPPGTQVSSATLPQSVPTPAAGQVAPPPTGMAAAQLPQPGSSIQQAGPQPGSYPAPALTEQQTTSQNVGASSVGMPSVIPVQSPIPTTIAESNIPPAPLGMQPVPSDLPQGAEARIAALQASSERLMTQLQADYTQKLSEYAAQNKALQDQMQLLSSRMAGMESQLSQLLQALARQMQGASAPSAAPPPPPAAAAIEQKLSYNVQAIIPGRAWLKSDNGETLTVAEGDVVRDLGRITKINPYDGVVEINTGNKVVSLSYGNGG